MQCQCIYIQYCYISHSQLVSYCLLKTLIPFLPQRHSRDHKTPLVLRSFRCPTNEIQRATLPGESHTSQRTAFTTWASGKCLLFSYSLTEHRLGSKIHVFSNMVSFTLILIMLQCKSLFTYMF